MMFSAGLGYCYKCGNQEGPWTYINGEWLCDDCYEANYGYNIEDDLEREEWINDKHSV